MKRKITSTALFFHCFLFSCFFAGESTGRCEPLRHLELREFVKMPKLSVQSVFAFNTEMAAFSIGKEEVETRTIEEIQASMDGTFADAKHYQDLGEAFQELEREDSANEAFEKARQLAQARLANSPEDAEAHRQLAFALWSLERQEESDQAFRRSLDLNPADWKGWFYLSLHYILRAYQAVAPNEEGKFTMEQVIGSLIQNPPTEEQYRRALENQQEAEDLLTQSIESNPEVARPYLFRATMRWLKLVIEEFQSEAGNNEDRARNAMLAQLRDPVVSDYRQIARLSPENPEVLTTVGMMEFMNAALNEPRILTQEIPLSQFPPENRESIIDVMGRLENLSKSSAKETASGALLGLAMLRAQQGQNEEALKSGMRCLELEPANEHAWSLVLGVLATQKDFVKMKELGLERLRQFPTANNHLIVAKALGHLEQWDGAKFHTLSAFALDRKNPKVLLARAASILRTATDSGQLEFANNMIDNVIRNRESIPEDQRDKENYADPIAHALKLGAVSLALTGDIDGAKAVIQRVYIVLPDDPDAKEIESALAGTGGQIK